MEREHRDMIGGILDLRELTVADVMIHRKNMATIDADLPPQEILREILETNYTRVPLWREQPENIVGVVHTKDIVRAILEGGRNRSRRRGAGDAALVRARHDHAGGTARRLPREADAFRAGGRRIRARCRA